MGKERHELEAPKRPRRKLSEWERQDRARERKRREDEKFKARLRKVLRDMIADLDATKAGSSGWPFLTGYLGSCAELSEQERKALFDAVKRHESRWER